MIKLLLCLFSAFAIAVVSLQLRQQRLELKYQESRLNSQVRAQQAKLWDQQLQIAIPTAPNAISKTVGQHALKIVPLTPLPPDKKTPNWIDPENNPDAE